MTVLEASKKVGVTKQTIYRWLKEEKFDATKKGKTYEIDPASLNEYLENRKDEEKSKNKEENKMSKKDEETTPKGRTSGFSAMKNTMNDIAETKMMERFLEGGNQKKTDDLEVGEIMKYRMISDLMQNNEKGGSSEVEQLKQQIREMQKEKEQNLIVSEISKLQAAIEKNAGLRDDFFKKEKRENPVSTPSDRDLKDLKNEIKDMIKEKRGTDWEGIVKAVGAGLGTLPHLLKGLKNDGYKLNDLIDAVGQISAITQAKQEKGEGGGDFLGKLLEGVLGGKKESLAGLAGTAQKKTESGITATAMLQRISQAVQDRVNPRSTAGLILNALQTQNLWGQGQSEGLSQFATPENVQNWIAQIADEDYAESVKNSIDQIQQTQQQAQHEAPE